MYSHVTSEETEARQSIRKCPSHTPFVIKVSPRIPFLFNLTKVFLTFPSLVLKVDPRGSLSELHSILLGWIVRVDMENYLNS